MNDGKDNKEFAKLLSEVTDKNHPTLDADYNLISKEELFFVILICRLRNLAISPTDKDIGALVQQFQRTGLEGLATAVSSMLAHGTQLKDLETALKASGTALASTKETLAEVLTRTLLANNACSLTINWELAEDNLIGVAKDLAANASLTSLAFHAPISTDLALQELVDKLYANPAQPLLDLKLSYNNEQLKPSGLITLATFLKDSKIRSFELSVPNITFDVARAFGQALEYNKMLDTFKLFHNNDAYAEDVLTPIVAPLVHNLSLLHLNLSATSGLSLATIKTIAKALECKSTALIHLDLQDGCADKKTSGTAIEALASGLSKNKTLEHLNVGGWEFGNYGIGCLADAVTTHPTLSALDVSGNYISGEGSLAIHTLLRHNNVISSLNLADNPLGNAGLNYTFRGLQFNTSLYYLNIISTSGSNSGITKCIETLTRNKNLVEIVFDTDGEVNENNATQDPNEAPVTETIQDMFNTALKQNYLCRLNFAKLAPIIAASQALKDLRTSIATTPAKGVLRPTSIALFLPTIFKFMGETFEKSGEAEVKQLLRRTTTNLRELYSVRGKPMVAIANASIAAAGDHTHTRRPTTACAAASK